MCLHGYSMHIDCCLIAYACMQEWHYKHAVRIGVENAAKHGLQEGALVLESTLAGTPSSSQELPAGDQPSPKGEAAVSLHCNLLVTVLVRNSCFNCMLDHLVQVPHEGQAIAAAEVLNTYVYGCRNQDLLL